MQAATLKEGLEKIVFKGCIGKVLRILEAKEWGPGETPLENGKVPLGGGAQGGRRRLSGADL